MQFPQEPARDALTGANAAALQDIAGAQRIQDRLAKRAWTTLRPEDVKAG